MNMDTQSHKTGHLWVIIQSHIDAQPYHVSHRQIARAVGVSSSSLSNWKYATGTGLPSLKNLHAIAEVTGAPYRRVLDAALIAAGYEAPPVTPDRETSEARASLR